MRKAWGWVLLCLALMAAPVCRAEMGTVTASALVLREGPGLDFAMLGEIPGGAELELLEYIDGWYWVIYNGQYGYVSGRYVRVALEEDGGYEAPQESMPMIEPMPFEAMPEAPIMEEFRPVETAPPGISLPELTFTGENNPGYPKVMKPGDMGNSVLDLQYTLQALGYTVSIDGQYGYDTQAAVMKLQLFLGIEMDGLVGAQTRRLIGNQNLGGVEKLDWFLGGNVAYARLTEATVVDVRTGKRFQISRYGGDNHCDAEPLTAKDTAIMLEIAGDAWTWERRPVWLEVGGRVICGSMHCMPHQGQHIMDNNFDGHFCLHFYNSRTHETDRIDEAHAACVEEAWNSRDRYSSLP